MAMKEHIEGDLNVAAFLLVRGCKLLGLASNDGSGRYSFRFQDSDGSAARTAMEYFGGGSVSAKEFAAAQRDLKSQLYGRKRADESGGYDHARRYTR